MSTGEMRQVLHDFIEHGNEQWLKIMYDMVRNIGHDSSGQRISIEQYNSEIDAALEEYEREGGISHEEVVRRLNDR